MVDVNNNIERRRHPRLEKSLPLKAFGETFDFVTETMNISLGGALCILDKPVPVMTKLRITLLIPAVPGKKSSRIDCEGVVLRVIEKKDSTDNKKFAVAIMFSDMKPADKRKISRYVSEHLKRLNLPGLSEN